MDIMDIMWICREEKKKKNRKNPWNEYLLNTRSCWADGGDCLPSCVPVEEIEQMTSLFHQKQRELLVAAARVEELSEQLDVLRSNRLEPNLPPPPPHHHSTSSSAELERLYRELQVRSPSRMQDRVSFFLLLIYDVLAMLCTCYAARFTAANTLLVFHTVRPQTDVKVMKAHSG